MTEVGLAIYGRPTSETLAQAGPALVRLLHAVADAKRLPRLEWQLSGWQRRCDTCGHKIPFAEELPPGWTSDGRYDACDACTVEAAR